MIRFENISKIYSTDTVLSNINWEVKKGEKIGLVGPNGAGKSTQFKILIGEEDQTSGQVIKYDGSVVKWEAVADVDVSSATGIGTTASSMVKVGNTSVGLNLNFSLYYQVSLLNLSYYPQE